MPFYTRHVVGDLLCFVHRGAGLLETEFGPLRYRAGDWVYLPKACTWRQVPDSSSSEATTLLMIEASDEFRTPPPGALGRHFPFDPSQAVIPDPEPIDDDDGRDDADDGHDHDELGHRETGCSWGRHIHGARVRAEPCTKLTGGAVSAK